MMMSMCPLQLDHVQNQMEHVMNQFWLALQLLILLQETKHSLTNYLHQLHPRNTLLQLFPHVPE